MVAPTGRVFATTPVYAAPSVSVQPVHQQLADNAQPLRRGPGVYTVPLTHMNEFLVAQQQSQAKQLADAQARVNALALAQAQAQAEANALALAQAQAQAQANARAQALRNAQIVAASAAGVATPAVVQVVHVAKSKFGGKQAIIVPNSGSAAAARTPVYLLAGSAKK